MIENTKKLFAARMTQAAIALFLVITIWWFAVYPFSPDQAIDQKHIWSASYESLSLLGAIFGLIISRYWGGYKSVIGRSILAFTAGLLLQTFGQVVYNYYTLVAGIEAPYPSIGDIGYFGSIFAYLYGAFLLARASGLHISLKSYHSRLIAIVIPLIMLSGSYTIFLSDYVFDWSEPLKIFLDFGYPLGQACYVSVAMLALLLSRNILGGLMKGPVLTILLALVIQYVCDFDFLYLANNGTWYAGGPGDYLYAFSYLVMTLALIYVGVRFRQIQAS